MMWPIIVLSSLKRVKYHANLTAVSFLILCLPLSSVNKSPEAMETISVLDLIESDAFFEVIEPLELQYSYRIKPARDFGVPFNASFSLKGTKLVPVEPIDGCSTPLNSDLIEGNVAFVGRGECSFLHKTIVAENAGALAIIITEGIIHSSWDVLPDEYIEMIADRADAEAHIPAAFLLGRSGMYIYSTLKDLEWDYAIINIPVNMTYVPIHKMNQPPWVSW